MALPKQYQNTKSRYKRNEEVPSLDGKMPPQAIELEESVLGAIMTDTTAYSEVCNTLSPESFYVQANQDVYKAMTNIASQQRPIDLATVTEELRKQEMLDSIGGPAYLANLTMNVISTVAVSEHAKIIAEKYLYRQLIQFSNLTQQTAYSESVDVDILIQQTEGKLFDISKKNVKKDYMEIGPVMNNVLTQIQNAINSTEKIGGVPSGFTMLDAKTNGWQKSDLIIIAARPAMGKTAFVLSMALNIARSNHGVAVFSLEMSNEQLGTRLLVNASEISSEKIKKGELSDEEMGRIQSVAKNLGEYNLFLDDSPGLSVFEFATKARRLCRDKGVEILIIDYLQLMNASGMSYGNREQEVSTISRSLKQLAKELNVPIIALSQLNRGVETRDKQDKRPQLADLRESGAIEQDADMVLFIHRPEYYKMDVMSDGTTSSAGMAEIIIAKHRNGATGDVMLRFIGSQTKFANYNSDDSSIDNQTTVDYTSSLNKTTYTNNDIASVAPNTPIQDRTPDF